MSQTLIMKRVGSDLCDQEVRFIVLYMRYVGASGTDPRKGRSKQEHALTDRLGAPPTT